MRTDQAPPQAAFHHLDQRSRHSRRTHPDFYTLPVLAAGDVKADQDGVCSPAEQLGQVGELAAPSCVPEGQCTRLAINFYLQPTPVFTVQAVQVKELEQKRLHTQSELCTARTGTQGPFPTLGQRPTCYCKMPHTFLAAKAVSKVEGGVSLKSW